MEFCYGEYKWPQKTPESAPTIKDMKISIPIRVKYRLDVGEIKIDNEIPVEARLEKNRIDEFISHAKLKSDLLMILFDACAEVLLTAQSLAKDQRPEADQLLTICRSIEHRALDAITT